MNLPWKATLRIKRWLSSLYSGFVLSLARAPGGSCSALFDLDSLGVGNTVMITPAIAALKAHCPTCSIDVKTSFPSLLEGWEVPHAVLSTYRRPSRRYDLVFSVSYNEWESVRLNRYTFRLPLDRSEAHWYFEQVQEMGYKGAMPPQYVATESVDLDFPPDALKIGIVPCGNDECYGLRGESKKWPYYDQLVRRLLAVSPSCRIYLVGGQKEQGEISARDKRIIDCVGWPSIPETAYILKQCDIAIGNDSGPMHIADAVGTKLYIIWGPTSEVKNSYLNERRDIFNTSATCRPCQGRDLCRRCDHTRCLTELAPTYVLSAIEEIR